MLVVEEKQIGLLLEEIKKSFDVFLYGEQSRTDDGRANPLPPKQHFFPPAQEIFTEDEKGNIHEPKSPKKFVLFGLGSKDLEALTQLDEIMRTPHEDFFYFQKRNLSTIIGTVDKKIDSMPGGDIIFEKLNDNKYKVWAENDKGLNFVKKYQKFFKEVTENGSPKDSGGRFSETEPDEWSDSMREFLLNPELLSNAVEWSKTHPIWDELAEQCLGCGICTYVCPLCHCFSIDDKVTMDGACSRCRKWDACTLPEFSEIAGGYNFRKSIKERYYNWFYHKFVRAYNEFGKSQCVGCGRCKYYCPAKIDIQAVLMKIITDFKSSQSIADSSQTNL